MKRTIGKQKWEIIITYYNFGRPYGSETHIQDTEPTVYDIEKLLNNITFNPSETRVRVQSYYQVNKEQ